MRRVRYPVMYGVRYRYAPTYDKALPEIFTAGERTNAEALFDFELERTDDDNLRVVSYKPGTDVITEIFEFPGSLKSALSYMDHNMGLFVKIIEV